MRMCKDCQYWNGGTGSGLVCDACDPQFNDNWREATMTVYSMDLYQELAGRTINEELTDGEKALHALHGLAGEVGEIHSLFQKSYQGHLFTVEHLLKELGDLMWFIAELCTAYGVSLNYVAEMNIEKLKARYPEGFNAEQSLHRKAGDI